MRVLVTGAAGFIGSHIAETMRAAGHDVRGLDSLTPAVHNGRPDHITGELAVGDVASGEPHTVGEMASTLAAGFGGIEPVVTGDFRLGDVRHIVASPDRATRDLGFGAQIRFAAGMAEFAHAPLREPATLTGTPA